MIGFLAALLSERLEAGDELQIPEALPLIKTIDFFDRACIAAGHDAEHVVFDVIAVKELRGMQHAGKGAFPGGIDAVEVVQVGRAVERQADQELVFGQKSRPFFINGQTIGLDAVDHAQSAGVAGFLQLDDLAEKI